MTKGNHVLLTVRPMGLSGLDAVAGWFDSLDDLSFFERSAVAPQSLEALRESWKADLVPTMPPPACWYIAEEPSGRPAAIAGLRFINYINGNAVLAAFVGRHMRGRGVGTRIAAMLLDLGFDRLRLVRVTTYCREDNHQSAKVLAKIGFCEEGRIRKALLVNGRQVDVLVLGILREEWLACRDTLHQDLARDTVLSFAGPGNEQYAWPRERMADNVVPSLAARRNQARICRSLGN